MNPDVLLTSSKADENFIDMANEFSMCGRVKRAFIHFTNHPIVETSNGIFQICPFKEFLPSKGRNKLLSLSCLSNLPQDVDDLPPSSEANSSSSRPNNAYGFMRSRREITGDPTAVRWNASIRLANFACIETSPLCVCVVLLSFGRYFAYI